jgi:lipoprotein-anchoring transpeptidase ErfK/SrfK
LADPPRYQEGMDLLAAGKAIEARSALSDALFAGGLSKAQEASAVRELTKLAKATIFSKTVYENDPLATGYTVQAGDTLSGVSRKYGLGVPTGVLEDINQVKGSTLAQGTAIKLIRGPFRGVIHKNSFALDVYLQAPSGQKIFVRRAKVAIGRNDKTPEGRFRVAGKAAKATWFPPPSMAAKYKAPVKWGQKGYPLGKNGYFMSLRGIDDSTRNVKGYGIHGTNAQGSIGKAASHGCVRVGEADIGTLYKLFTEGATTIDIAD